MVERLDGTIYCICNIFKAGAPVKPERLIQIRKNTHDKVRKEKAYAYFEYDRYAFYLEGGQLKKSPATGQGF